VADEESSRALSNLAKSRGINMVPWAAWVLDYLPARTELKDGLSDLSDYLASYCTRGGDAIGSAGKSDEGSQRLGQIDAKSFARISAFLIFGRLFRKVVYGEENFPLETFFDERVKYLSSRDALDDPIDQADYIFGISNLLMMIARLDLKSTKEELVSKGELKRDFLFDVDAECLDLACISPLPGSGFIQVIEAINPYEGDRPEAYHLDKAFRVADYGLDVPWNSELFFEMYEGAYSGLDPEVSPHLKAIIHRAAKGWIIPLHQCGSIVRIYDDFWSDQLIVEKISDAMFRAERSEFCLPLMHTDELKQSNFQSADFESDYHPAIFARKFSNHVDFVRFQGQQWFEFCRALIHSGQPRHACTVLALYITIIGINRLFNIEAERTLNVRIVMKLLNELSGYNSFRTVRQSIGDLFEMSSNIPEIYKGSLKEFLPIQKAQVISIKDVVEEDLNKHEERLIREGHIITRLSKEAKGSLLKGYTLARTETCRNLILRRMR
jgi:hypothetical protein